MEIKSKKELNDILMQDKLQYFKNGKITFEDKYRTPVKYQIFRYIVALRKYEYLCYKRDNCKNKLLAKFWVIRIKKADRKKNKIGLSTCIEVTPNHVGKGLRICHPNVVINGYVGENCVFHGNNVVGNKITGSTELIPTIGSNVDIGTGATIIGNVTIADNCVIGAGAVVTKSFTIPGTIIVGVPAKSIN